EFYPQIGTPASLSAPSLAAAAKETAKHVITKDIAEVLEDVFHAHAASETTASGSAHPGMTEPVVLRALVRIAQYIVGFGSLLKLLFCFLVARITVWMVLQSDLAISFLDLILRSTLCHSQHFVIISF